MSYSVEFEKKTLKIIAKWKRTNPQLYKRFKALLEDLLEHPRTGLGHPEPLVGGNNITYSRHITAHDRIIYNIYDERVMILVIQVEEHYDDK